MKPEKMKKAFVRCNEIYDQIKISRLHLSNKVFPPIDLKIWFWL